MTTKIKLLIGLLAISLASSLIIGFMAEADVSRETPEAEVQKKELSHRQKAWLGALEWCESRGNPEAVNKKDRDGTPSYGILQFKPSTFKYYGERYGIGEQLELGFSPDGYMNPDGQEFIVEQMIIRGDVDWNQQFPDCVKKLGKPPVH